jgi:transcriptional regulator with XRE-family HTH domain
MADLRAQFGKRLRKIRRDKDMTQEQLAEAIGVTMEYISRMEGGRYSPSFQVLEKLAEVLEVEVEEFFHFPKDKS